MSERAPIEATAPRAFETPDDDVDMDAPVEIIDRREVYRGAVFHVEDMTIGLRCRDGRTIPVRRQVMRHAPCVVMLVHDEKTDRYLIEREYRVGSGRYAYGIPAGMMDEGEDVETAALRELAEETGVAPAGPESVRFDHVGDYYSSEGMTDELAHIMVIHLDGWRPTTKRPDADEHVASAWTDWNGLLATPVTASNSIIAIQHERIRRLTGEREARTGRAHDATPADAQTDRTEAQTVRVATHVPSNEVRY